MFGVSAAAATVRRVVASVATIAACYPSIASAERDLTLAAATVEYTPSAEVEGAGGVSFGSIRWTVGALVPLPLSKKTTLIVVPGYRLWLYRSSEADDVEVHDLGVITTVRHALNSTWGLTASVGTGLATDFGDVDADHFRVTGAASADYTVNDRLRLGAGVAANYSFGTLLPVPLLTVDWVANDRLRVVAVLPQRAGVRYRVLPRIELAAALHIDGNRFSVQGEAAQLESLSLSRATVTARVAVRIANRLWLVAYGGHTVFRRLKVFDESENELADLGLENSFVGGGAIEFRIPLPTD